MLTVRKFFCRNPGCPRNVFTERLPDFIEASSRLTKRLRTAVQEVGFATCGKGGEQLSDKLGMGVCDATVLWSLFLVPLPEIGQVHVVGVDDWSWRRGKRFGSILVNLETHKIIDVLADREAESVKRWFAAHPEVDVVSRDRGAVYIDGVDSEQVLQAFPESFAAVLSTTRPSETTPEALKCCSDSQNMR